ncbi:MAG: hypothetical protein AAF493_01780 [Pseudomonadota bacterium]
MGYLVALISGIVFGLIFGRMLKDLFSISPRNEAYNPIAPLRRPTATQPVPNHSLPTQQTPPVRKLVDSNEPAPEGPTPAMTAGLMSGSATTSESSPVPPTRRRAPAVSAQREQPTAEQTESGAVSPANESDRVPLSSPTISSPTLARDVDGAVTVPPTRRRAPAVSTKSGRPTSDQAGSPAPQGSETQPAQSPLAANVRELGGASPVPPTRRRAPTTTASEDPVPSTPMDQTAIDATQDPTSQTTNTAERAPSAEPAGSTPANRTASAPTSPRGTPAPGDIDDLRKIKGIGPKLEGLLHEQGVTQYRQIAKWTPADIRRVDEDLPFPGRIERDDWIEQATRLHHEKYGRAPD